MSVEFPKKGHERYCELCCEINDIREEIANFPFVSPKVKLPGIRYPRFVSLVSKLKYGGLQAKLKETYRLWDIYHDKYCKYCDIKYCN